MAKKNKSIVCPNCGATLEKSDYVNVNCPYCGGKLISNETYRVDEIVLFEVDEEEAKQELAWELAQDDNVPLELFDTLSFNATKIYIPLWHLGGSYIASWSCDRLEYKEEVYYDKNDKRRTRRATYPDRYPVNGNAQGVFDILISASHGFSYSSRYDSFSSKEFDEELIDKDASIFKMDIENGEAWEKKDVGDCIDDAAESHVKHQLPEEYDRFYSKVSYNRALNSSVLFPFWELEYEYKGKSYKCILRGDDGEVTSYNHPKVKKNLNDNSDLKTPIRIGKIGWLCFLLFIVAGLLAVIIRVNNLSSVGVVIECVLLSSFSLFALINLYSRQYDEEKSFEKVTENRKKKRHEERLNALVDVPLLQPYKKQLSKVSDIKISPKEHNKRVVGDSRIKKLYSLIITISIPLIIISYIVSGIVSRIDKHEQEIVELTNQNEFKIGDIQYRVLSFDDMTVEVSDGKDCKGKVEIPAKVQNGRNEYTVIQIGLGAFRGNQEIASLSMPNTVLSIMEDAFERCKLVSFSPSENVVYISPNAFGSRLFWQNCPIKPENNVVYIGKVAYQFGGDKYEHTGISIKEGTLYIADEAFMKCESIESVRLPNSLKTIGRRAFEGCWGLQSIDIPRNVEYIGEKAFYECYHLATITVQDKLLMIGKDAFNSTKWYQNLMSDKQDVLEAAMDSVDEDFVGLEMSRVEEPVMNEICRVEDNLVYIGTILYGFKEPVSYGTEIVVMEGTKGIAECAFRGCSGIVSVKLPSSIVAIGERAFENCKGLEQINIPQSVKMIGKNSFVGCVSLEKEAMQVDGTYGRDIYNDYILY